MGYIFGAAVSLLVGKGDVMHSTAISIVMLSLLMLGVAFMSKRIPAGEVDRTKPIRIDTGGDMLTFSN